MKRGGTKLDDNDVTVIITMIMRIEFHGYD